MFEDLFVLPYKIEMYRKAPLAEHRLRYLRHLKEAGARRSTLLKRANDQLSLVRLLDLREGDRVSVSQIEAAAADWSRPGGRRCHRSASPKVTTKFIGHAIGWLRFHGWLEEAAVAVRHPHGTDIATYEAWLRSERGLSERTIRDYCDAADQFFDWLAANDIPLASVAINDIDGAIAAKATKGTCGRRTVHAYAQRLRAFFRFAEDRGWCMPGIAVAVIPPRFYPDETVPAGRTREEVLRLLATTEGERPADKRDRAILMLLIAYGLRVGEVCGLRLEDLDWENELLRVRRPKPGRTHLYPLSRSVGQAVLRYILEVRPSRPERALFFTLVAPIRALGRKTVGRMVSRRLDDLGIVAGRRGPHALRHAAAQHLLDQGMSMKVIGDFLGHRDPSSTAIYAKVDLNALREVANLDLEGLV